MEEELVEKLRDSITDMEEFMQEFSESVIKYEGMDHRQELEVEKFQRRREERRMKSSSQVELDKERNKIVIRGQNNKIYEISYNKHEDRFWMADCSNREILQIVS